MAKQRFEKMDKPWRGGPYQPIIRDIKIDPETGLPPLPRGGTAECVRRVDQSIRNESANKK
jgi:hypothetical protein